MKPADSEFHSILSRLVPEKTDEEWEAHDARVARERARFSEQDREKLIQEKLDAMVERGLSRRHLDAMVERGLSRRHLDAIASQEIKPSPALTSVRSIRGKRGFFALSGNVGCGKTYGAHLWLTGAPEVIPEDWLPGRVRMVTAAWFARKSRYEQEVNKFELLGKPKMLVIDDLGVEYADKGGSFLVDLEELLDIRWQKKVSTMVLTNLDLATFKERYGRRIYDRARDEGGWFDVKRESMRGEKK